MPALSKSSAGTVTAGAGTNNTIAKFTGGSSLGNSGFTDDGTIITTGENIQITGALFLGLGAQAKTRFNASGLLTKYNSIQTAGLGLSTIMAVTSQKSETGADNNLLTYTPPATAGCYRLRFIMDVSAANAATLGWTITYKDSNGNAVAPTNVLLLQTGSAAAALTFTTSAVGNYYGIEDITIDNSATNIVIKTTFTGTSFAALDTATIEQLI